MTLARNSQSMTVGELQIEIGGNVKEHYNVMLGADPGGVEIHCRLISL